MLFLFKSKGYALARVCLALILSDISLTHHDRQLLEKRTGFSVFNIFRYVNDFLVLFNVDLHSMVDNLLKVFTEALHRLALTV